MTVASVDYVEAFRQACAALQVKPVLLDPQTRNQGVIKDAMTSSVFFGCNAEALAQLVLCVLAWKSYLGSSGAPVCRGENIRRRFGLLRVGLGKLLRTVHNELRSTNQRFSSGHGELVLP